ncbi:MAG: hypothetical protein H7Z12_14595 [Rhodospirillaceae bacterium]|nr:hypothetical protein [Rhodospirillales bacterium]
MWFNDYPMVLEVSAAERDRALMWLMKNHSTLDCKVQELSGGGAEIRVRDGDCAVLDALGALLEGSGRAF